MRGAVPCSCGLCCANAGAVQYLQEDVAVVDEHTLFANAGRCRNVTSSGQYRCALLCTQSVCISYVIVRVPSRLCQRAPHPSLCVCLCA